MKWYTAIGCKMEDDEGRLLVKIDGQEKVLTEMEGMLWAALTWSLCAENRIYSQMYRVLCLTFGEEYATEWADEEDFLFCLRRLKKRGLVAECDGESKEEALWLLLSKSVVSPVTDSFSERLGAFADDLALGKGLKIALRAFKRPVFTYEERMVLQLTCRWWLYSLSSGRVNQTGGCRSPVCGRTKDRSETGLAGIHADPGFPI